MVDEPQLLVTSPGDPELSQIHWFPLGSGNVTRNQGAGKTAGTSALCLRFPQHLGVPVTLDAITPLPQTPSCWERKHLSLRVDVALKLPTLPLGKGGAKLPAPTSLIPPLSSIRIVPQSARPPTAAATTPG